MSHAFVIGTGPGAVTFSYGHDAAGKTTTIGINQPAFDWMPTLAYARSYGVANVLNQVASEAGVAIAFNSDGNMTSDGVNTYSWTFGNRMSGATRTGMTAVYDYDSDDRRTKKTVNNLVTRTMWSGADEMAELDASGNVLRRFVPDGSGAMDGRLATVEANGTVYWHHISRNPAYAQTGKGSSCPLLTHSGRSERPLLGRARSQCEGREASFPILTRCGSLVRVLALRVQLVEVVPERHVVSAFSIHTRPVSTASGAGNTAAGDAERSRCSSAASWPTKDAYW